MRHCYPELRSPLTRNHIVSRFWHPSRKYGIILSMGAGKLPEQIGERAHDAALDADHQPHPSIEQSRALPTDSATRHKTDKLIIGMTPKMQRERKRIAMRMVAAARLKDIYALLDKLRANAARNPNDKGLKADISTLSKAARKLRATLPRPKRKRRGRRRF